MSEHVLLDPESLNTNILEETRSCHKLNKCPLCGEEFTDNLCMQGVDLQINSYSDQDNRYSSCQKCKIIWRLEIFNWTNERGDGMINGEGHKLTLRAYSNCYCQAPLFDRFGIGLENNDSGHSRLNCSCTLTEKEAVL